MRPYELWIAHMAWDGGGKRRPALILSSNGRIIKAYAITSQYENKSEYIKEGYFAINDWQKANLQKPSYVDTNTVHKLSVDAIDEAFVGRLSQDDIERFSEFLEKRN